MSGDIAILGVGLHQWGKWGANFDRTQAWWKTSAKSWVKNITRNQYLLRQGIPDADILLYTGDGTPNGCGDRHRQRPILPNHLNYDCITPTVLQERIKVENKRLVLPEGGSYELLYLKNSQQVALKTLRLLNEYSKAGVVIVGGKPTELLALTYEEQVSHAIQQEFKQLVDDIWSRPTTETNTNWQSIFAKHNLNFGFKT